MRRKTEAEREKEENRNGGGGGVGESNMVCRESEGDSEGVREERRIPSCCQCRAPDGLLMPPPASAPL